MRQTLLRIDPLRVGLVVGLMYAVLGLVFTPFFLLALLVDPDVFGFFGMAFALMLPVLYGIMGGIVGMVGSWLYNRIAALVGGIIVEWSPAGSA